MNERQLADLLEREGADMLRTIIRALRASAAPIDPSAGGGPAWKRVGSIEGFAHKWPEVHEHYPELLVYEIDDGFGPVRFGIGVPDERIPIYGSERGWASVWEVVHGQPREQRAVFVETDDFSTTGDRIALIGGKGGQPKRLFGPDERAELPDTYEELRIAIHKDVCRGPYAKNRLGVLATDDEVAAMLAHALWNVRLRSS